MLRDRIITSHIGFCCCLPVGRAIGFLADGILTFGPDRRCTPVDPADGVHLRSRVNLCALCSGAAHEERESPAVPTGMTSAQLRVVEAASGG